MTDRLTLYVLIAACLILGIAVAIELSPEAGSDSSRAETSERSGAGLPAARRPPREMLDELLATILARPLFSSTRRPPQSAVSDGAASADLADTRLTGIIIEPARRIAIFAITGAKPLRLTEGEAVSGWRIESITPREVALSGPSGTKTLEPKFDPNLGSPPPGPTPAPTAAGRPAVAPLPAAAAAVRPNIPPVPGQLPPRPRRAERQQ
jgi:hypothetical protein